MAVDTISKYHTISQMKTISPTRTPFLQSFKHLDPRSSLSPIIWQDDSWPTRGVSGHVQKGVRYEARNLYISLYISVRH